ncbi:MAG TPA: response regulator [Pyrinomonadaceae bacterium]|jgi:CheY-like chemotaxis protein
MKASGGRVPTILIVEDIDWIRSGMKNSVESYGYRVVEATNDVEAIGIAEPEPPALFMTEEELPTFDALMTRLREHPSLRHIPVVIINPDADERARYGDAFLLTSYDSISSLLASLRG